jgi:hypothetical protein
VYNAHKITTGYFKREFLMRIIFIVGTIISLIGCTHEVTLQNPNGKDIAKAELNYEGNSSGNLVLNKNGVIYKGRWEATKVDESAAIAKTYGIGSRRYKDYLQGRGEYLKTGESQLKSESGETLNCYFKYRGSTAQGVCSSDTETFDFMVKS